MTSGIIDIIKQASQDANEASKPCNWSIGSVVSTSPLQIRVGDKMILPMAFLELTPFVSNHTVTMTVDHQTGETEGGSGEGSFDLHSHTYSGTKTFTVNNGLEVGDEVILLRQQGGQKYLVLCKRMV